MKVLDQGFIFCTVNRTADLITSKTMSLNRSFEAEASLVVDARNFGIKKADYEIHKSNKGSSPGRGSASELIGLEAYFNIIRELSKLLKLNGGEKVKMLFTECVKGLIQAETYVFAERGFPDEAAYENYWREREKSGCRYYSHVNEYTDRWFEHVGSYRREDNLFNRCKNYKIMEDGPELICQGTFSDSYHEMAAEISFDRKTEIIRQCELSIFRAPGCVCFDNGKYGERFSGKKINTITKRQLIDMVGGSQGCYHLVDIMSDIFRAISELKERTVDSLEITPQGGQ